MWAEIHQFRSWPGDATILGPEPTRLVLISSDSGQSWPGIGARNRQIWGPNLTGSNLPQRRPGLGFPARRSDLGSLIEQHCERAATRSRSLGGCSTPKGAQTRLVCDISGEANANAREAARPWPTAPQLRPTSPQLGPFRASSEANRARPGRERPIWPTPGRIWSDLPVTILWMRRRACICSSASTYRGFFTGGRLRHRTWGMSRPQRWHGYGDLLQLSTWRTILSIWREGGPMARWGMLTQMWGLVWCRFWQVLGGFDRC